MLNRDFAVLNTHTAFQSVQLSDVQWLGTQINAGYVGATLSHAFAENAAPTADIQHFLTGQRTMAVDVVGTQRVNVVQGFEFALAIPPT